MDSKEIKNRLREHYDYVKSLGYEVVAIFLQGSQNYNLDIYEKDYRSDIDTKCIIIPTLDDLIKGNHMVSTKYDFQGEQIDVKDIRVMMEMWKKQNQSYVEILFTDYKIINPKYKELMQDVISMKNEIAQLNTSQLARCISGMSKEKVCALEHEYPATKQKINKYGYDPKQLVSIIRLTHLIENIFDKNLNFKKAMWYDDGETRDYMISVKKGKCNLEEARELATLYDNKTESIKNRIVEEFGKENFNDEIYRKLQKAVYRLVKFGIISSVQEQMHNAWKDVCDSMKYFTKEEQEKEEEIIREMSVEAKENFFDYYKEEE